MNILKELSEFLLMYWTDILLVVVILLGLFVLWRKGKKKIVIRLAREAVIFVERKWTDESGWGAAKKLEAIRWIHKKLPPIVRIFVTEEQLDLWVEDAWEWMIDWLDTIEDMNPDEDGGDIVEYST